MLPRVFLLLLCALGTLTISAGAHPPPILSMEQEKPFTEEIVAWREHFIEVAKRKDRSTLLRYYAPSFVHTASSGERIGRDEQIEAVLRGDAVIELAPADNIEIRVPGGWTAIATATSPITSPDGKTYRVAWTAVYVRAGDGWQLAASHATRLGEIEH